MISKRPLALRPIHDPTWAPRMAAVHAETMGRTGGAGRGPDDFARSIRFAAAHPDLSHLVGLFRTDATGPNRCSGSPGGAGTGSQSTTTRPRALAGPT